MNILVLSHGDLAEGLCKTVNMFFNGAKLDFISLSGEGVERFSSELCNYLEKTAGEVLILCDLLGATPFNQAVSICSKLGIKERTEIVAGVNLPMILELYAIKESIDLKEAKSICLTAGRDGIGSFSQIEYIQDEEF